MSLMFNNLFSYYKYFSNTNNDYVRNYYFYRKSIEEELKETSKYSNKLSEIEKTHKKYKKNTNMKKKNIESIPEKKESEFSSSSEIIEKDMLEKGLLKNLEIQNILYKDLQNIADEKTYNIIDTEDIQEYENDSFMLV